METFNLNRIISLHRIRAFEIRSPSRRFTYRSSFLHISAFKNQRSSGFLSDSLAWSNIYTSRKNYMGTVFAGQGNNKTVQASAANTGPSGKPWCNWLVGVILSLVLPLASRKWSRLLAIKNEVDMVVKTVETVVETVETVAKEVAHVADEVAHQLPEGGKLQNIVCNVANVAEETAKDAHLMDQLIEKVEDMEKEVESAFVGEELHEKAAKVERDDDEVTKDDIQTEKGLLLEPKHDIAMEVSQDDEISNDQPK